MQDELFEPTLKKSRPSYNPRPWSSRSEFMVAFFGGALALTVYAYLNSQQLKLKQEQLNRILLIGVIALLASAVGYIFLLPDQFSLAQSTSAELRLPRYVARIFSVIAYVAMRRVQQGGFRMFEMFEGDSGYGSPWKVGLLTTFVLGTIQNFTLVFLAGLL